jgi:hypothetical protein
MPFRKTISKIWQALKIIFGNKASAKLLDASFVNGNSLHRVASIIEQQLLYLWLHLCYDSIYSRGSIYAGAASMLGWWRCSKLHKIGDKTTSLVYNKKWSWIYNLQLCISESKGFTKNGYKLYSCSKFKIAVIENWEEKYTSKVLSLLEACFDLISGSSLSMIIQIMGGKITENLGFKSPLRKVKSFLFFFLFIFKFFTQKWVSFILTIFWYLV